MALSALLVRKEWYHSTCMQIPINFFATKCCAALSKCIGGSCTDLEMLLLLINNNNGSDPEGICTIYTLRQ